jgi:UDP-N-acetylglucosamine--N-acetylmuramyl-(pentapeptide) pyrophosphoryl-undecaprenol N-acetylglucosamine transferase
VIKKRTILIAAGGTGGHIFPAMAVAEAYKRSNYGSIHWLGVKGRLEEKIVKDRFPIDFLTLTGLRGKNIVGKIKSLLQLISATIQAMNVIRRVQPHVVLSMGGYPSAPAAIAARLLRKPLVLHEQNAKAGLTNKWLAKVATCVLTAFPNVIKGATVVGNPVRHAIIDIPEPRKRLLDRRHALHLLVLGGSQGAHFLNTQVPKVLKTFSFGLRPIVWHQSGFRDHDQVLEDYRAISLDAKVNSFIRDIAQAYEWADLVIARAGALTCSEIAAAGLASILVPYPYAIDNHQYYNAKFLAAAKASVILMQKTDGTQKLIDLLNKFLQDRTRIFDMSCAARRLAKPHATDAVIKACLDVIK